MQGSHQYGFVTLNIITQLSHLWTVDKALERSAASGGFVKFLEDVMRQAFHNIRLCSKKQGLILILHIPIERNFMGGWD